MARAAADAEMRRTGARLRPEMRVDELVALLTPVAKAFLTDLGSDRPLPTRIQVSRLMQVLDLGRMP